MTFRTLTCAAALLSLAFAAPVLAKPKPVASAVVTPPKITPMTPDVFDSYDKVRPDADFVRRVIMVPMRDGVKLYTVVVFKKGTKDGPILLSRTPYDAKGSMARTSSQSVNEVLAPMYKEFVNDGYIIVTQDIRGIHNSEGVYVMNRPLAGPLNDTGIDESTDAYDTIDWLSKNIPESNGKVGIVGSSYLGFTSLLAEINPHPALKAAVPQSPMVDGWMGDDWFHNGAFRTSSFDYALEQSTGKAEAGAAIPGGVGDDYNRYLDAGSIGDYARKWGIDQVPFVRKLMENPAYTTFWSGQAVDKWMAAAPLKVPTMLVVGQWDQEDSYGAPAVYKVMEPKDTNNDMVSLVIGPWRHSGVNHYGYDLGTLTFTGDTAQEFRVKYMKPFFDHYLKGTPDPKTPPVLTYATGANHWNESPKWPMGTLTPLYIGENFTASFTKPATDGHDDYVSDPSKPVPFIPRPISMADPLQWKPWLVHDQRFVSDRPDVLTYTSTALDKPVHIMGAPVVDLYAATSGTDSDWVVKIIDVYPNESPEDAAQGSKPGMAGFELPIGIEIFRGRYVHGFDKPQALTPGKIEQYKFELPNVDHVFLPGHKLMIQVQSSLFPLYDRNPQTYVDNIFNAKPADYKAATESIYRTPTAASAVWLPIVAQ
jgi:putative CocE/NonD family hydrolase